MSRIIINAVLLLLLHQILLAAAAKEEKTWQFNQQIEEQCKSCTNQIVKPLLEYIIEIRKEFHQSEVKERQINELNSNLIEKYQEIVKIHEKIKQEAFLLDEYKKKIQNKEHDLQLCQIKVDILQSQINSQETILIKKYDECKVELATKSNNLNSCEVKLNNLNSVKILNVTDNAKKIQLQFEESQTKLLKKENNHQFGLAEVEKLNKPVQNNIPSGCIPFGENPGVHEINVSGELFFNVICDSELAGPGWMVIQQRVGGTVNFTRDWASYREGFGLLRSDFFLGLEKIHRLTSSQRYELYVNLVGLDGLTKYARYDNFKISDEETGYALSLGEYEGDVEDKLRDGENMKFSTFDRDNDTYEELNCANHYSSGWWYRDCSYCNLNALYGPQLRWYNGFALKEAKMLIRPKI